MWQMQTTLTTAAGVSPEWHSCSFWEKWQRNSRWRPNLGCLMAPRRTRLFPGVLLAMPPLAYPTDTGTAVGYSSVVLGDREEGNKDISRMEQRTVGRAITHHQWEVFGPQRGWRVRGENRGQKTDCGSGKCPVTWNKNL